MATTERQRRGTAAENAVVDHLRALEWTVVARNVRVGRDEIDLLAIDPGPPAELVFVEVRSATSRRFGEPEERVDRGKVGHLYRAMWAITKAAHFPTSFDGCLAALTSSSSIAALD